MVSFLLVSEEGEGILAFFFFSKTLFADPNCVFEGQEHCRRSEQEAGNMCTLVMAVDKHFQGFQYVPCSSKIPNGTDLDSQHCLITWQVLFQPQGWVWIIIIITPPWEWIANSIGNSGNSDMENVLVRPCWGMSVFSSICLVLVSHYCPCYLSPMSESLVF